MAGHHGALRPRHDAHGGWRADRRETATRCAAGCAIGDHLRRLERGGSIRGNGGESRPSAGSDGGSVGSCATGSLEIGTGPSPPPIAHPYPTWLYGMGANWHFEIHT